ncbi:MAG: hypothetical protein ACRDPI_08110, partial [Nocardioidaceae bacterium]
MTELPDLTGLAVESSERTRPPAFESLVRRAGVRRRRQAVGVVAATAIVMGGAGVAFVPRGHSSTPPPVHRSTGSPSPSTSTAPTPRQRLAAADAAQIVARGSLDTYAENGTGAVMTTWKVCVDAETFCRYAWRLDTGTHVVRGIAPAFGFGPSAYATGELFVLATGGDGDGDIVDGAGRVTTFGFGQRGVPAAGDVIATYGKG